MQELDISIDNISKTEGHAGLDIKVRNGKVVDVNFKITENKRFYTKAIRGKSYVAAPQLMARICGTCSIAHLLCCIKAVESALGVEVTQQTMLLRELTMHGLMIRDHALHLYMFSLPDVFDRDSIMDFDNSNPRDKQLLEDAFTVKSAGNNLSKLMAGRAVHPPFPTIGGFARIPDKAKFPEMVRELETARKSVLRLIEVYRICRLDFTRKTNFVCLANSRFDYLSGEINSSAGTCIPEKLYRQHLERVVLPYSQASAYKFEGKEYMVGALSRVNLSEGRLHSKTKEDAKKALETFPSSNIFHNNLAQAIEILHSIDTSISLLNTLNPVSELPAKPTRLSGAGVGVIEAPRGTLYYFLDIDEKGIVRKAEVVVPTGQNQINIEKDVAAIVEKNLSNDRNFIENELEKLIRAYDPCMSCASHFLKVKWT